MAPNGSMFAHDSLTPLAWVAIIAALVTAGIHLILGIQIGGFFGTLFLVSAAGFVGGVIAVLIGWQRRIIYALGIPYTAGQVVLWYVLNDPPFPISHLIDKTAQGILIVALVVLLVREQ